MFNRFRKKAPDKPVVPAPSKGKVLIVDDDAVIRKTLGLKIGEAGYELLFAGDGSEAVAVTRRENPNLIILDINFPPEPGIAWDGFKLLRWLRRSPEGTQIPVIIITGEGSPSSREKTMEAGAVGFFKKPVDMPSLLAAIDKLVSG